MPPTVERSMHPGYLSNAYLVFDEPGMDELVAMRLSDPELVRRAKVFPYQLLVAWIGDGHLRLGVRGNKQPACQLQ